MKTQQQTLKNIILKHFETKDELIQVFASHCRFKILMEIY